MATQNCPKCGSGKVRAGYRRTSILSKLIFRYNLLCDTCNLEFKGFAIPGTVGGKTKKQQKKFSDPNYLSPESLRQINLARKEEVASSPIVDAGQSIEIPNDQEHISVNLDAENPEPEEIKIMEKPVKEPRKRVKVRQRVKVRF